MNDDYLSLAVELYENGTWDKTVFIKRVTLYAKEKGIDDKVINDFFSRVVEKEYSIEEKRRFLSVLTLNGEELKYGNAVKIMKDDKVEDFYQMEVSTLDKDKVKEYHDLANNNRDTKQSIEEKEVVFHTTSLNQKDDSMEEAFHMPELLEEEKETVSHTPSLDQKDNSMEDIFHMPEPLEEEFVINNAKKKEQDIFFEEPVQKETNPVIPPVLFEEEEQDMPHTEEEFKKQDENITKKEKDSSVRKIQISPERLEKLKKSKSKVINYFLKTAVLIASVHLLGPLVSGGLILGYSYFAEEVKKGTFNPTNPVGKAVKYAVEKVMYMGMGNDKDKGGRSK